MTLAQPSVVQRDANIPDPWQVLAAGDRTAGAVTFNFKGLEGPPDPERIREIVERYRVRARAAAVGGAASVGAASVDGVPEGRVAIGLSDAPTGQSPAPPEPATTSPVS
jgi:hypothetical protein